MDVKGIPSIEDMHNAYLKTCADKRESSLGMYAYILEVLKKFSGMNAIPRVICDIVTQEYLRFQCREGHPKDLEEIPLIAKEFAKAGYYVELNNSDLDISTETVSFLFCWDSQVIENYEIKIMLPDPQDYSLYCTVLSYMNAEKRLPESTIDQKEEINIDACYTKQWTAVSIISSDMYNRAIRVGHLLWDRGKYIGIRKDPRKTECWTMFVCWDPRITTYRGEATQFLEFEGYVPKSWR